MRHIALALLVIAACKSSEKSSTSPEPTPSAAPVPDEKNAEPAAPAVEPAANAGPANALVVGSPVRKEWKDGGPGEVVWMVAGGGQVKLTAKPGEPEGMLMAEFQGKQQHVTNFSCDMARAGSEAAFALTPEGKVLFRAAVGPAGKKPGQANVFLLEWKPDKETVFVANGWQGLDGAEPPPWAKI
jgi:hypothetical protein